MYFLASSNWWEPNSSGIVDIGDLTAFLVFFTSLAGILLGISRWWIKLLKKIIHEELATATAPIHPDSNGGLSLADVARRTTRLEERIIEIHDQNVETHKILTDFLLKTIDPKPVSRSRSAKKTES